MKNREKIIKIPDFLGDITSSAILHLASTVPKKLQFSATDFNAYNTVKTGSFKGSLGGAKIQNGERMSVGIDQPGLGIEPNFEVLKHVFTIE